MKRLKSCRVRGLKELKKVKKGWKGEKLKTERAWNGCTYAGAEAEPKMKMSSACSSRGRGFSALASWLTSEPFHTSCWPIREAYDWTCKPLALLDYLCQTASFEPEPHSLLLKRAGNCSHTPPAGKIVPLFIEHWTHITFKHQLTYLKKVLETHLTLAQGFYEVCQGNGNWGGF